MNTLIYFNHLFETYSGDIQIIRKKFYDLNIKTVYVENYNILLLYTKNCESILSLHSKHNLIKSECNGLIIDIEKKKILVKPMYYCCNIYHKYQTKKHMQNNIYNIYKLKDGTKINLYYFDRPNFNKWILSTNKGYDISNINWRGKPFIDAFKESIQKKLKISLKEFFEKLDKKKCYTMGFTNPSYHPFAYNNYDVWFIQNVNLSSKNLKPNFESDIDILDNQEKVNINDINELSNININSLSNFIKKTTTHFGYIMMSKDINITGKNSNIILTSSLMNKLKKFIYTNKINSFIHDYNYNDYEYITIYHYLKRTESMDLFVMMFPNFNKILNKLKKITEILVNKIEQRFEKTIISGQIDMLKKSKFMIDEIEKLNIYDATADYLYKKMQNYIKYNNYQHANIIDKILQDYIRNTEHIKLYYQLLNGKCPFS